MRRIFFLFFLVAPLVCSAQKAICVTIDSFFPFDPSSGRYSARSLAPVHSYCNAWRAEGSDVKLFLRDSLWFGYRFYCQSVDTTLYGRVLDYLEAQPTLDTTLQAVDVSGFPPSKDFLTFFDSDIERIKRIFATPISQFDTILRFDPYSSSRFTSLFHSFQLELSGAQLSIFTPPYINAQLPAQCFIKHIASMFRFDNQLVVVEMSGAQIKQMLEQSYARRFYQLTDQRSDLLRTWASSLWHQSLAPTRFTVNLTKGEGRKIENWPLDNHTIYSVALNSYLAREMSVLRSVGDYKTLLINWLLSAPNVNSVTENYQLQPLRYVEQIVGREERTIFGK